MDSNNNSDKFTTIGQGIYLYRPSTPVPQETRDPNLIIIFGWMGAKLSHLHKYTEVYQELYPTSTQVVIRCHWTAFWMTPAALRNRVKPILELLEAHGCLPTVSKPDDLSSVLVHLFSFGGLYQLNHLHESISKRQSALAISPPSSLYSNPRGALIFDSSPTNGGMDNRIRAFTAAVKNPVIIRILVAFFYLDHWVRQFLIFLGILSKENWVIRICKTFNTPSVYAPNSKGPGATYIPWMTQNAPRLYLYSKKDDMVSFEDVEGHAAEAWSQGGLSNVRLERFEDTPHVAHARRYPDRYWGAVKDIWALVVGS